MGAFDVQVPIFFPLWPRVMMVAFGFIWCIGGFYTANAFWRFFLGEWAEIRDQTDECVD